MITEILGKIENDSLVSDVHLATGEHIAYRKNGDIVRDSNSAKISSEQLHAIVMDLMWWDTTRYEKFKTKKDADFSYVSNNHIPYRVNAYFSTGKLAVVLRKINRTARKLEELMFSDTAAAIKEKILQRKKGLYLVTGATGSGKSTSLVSMLEHINKQRKEHIITIEDPIEFVFTPDKCLISQREVGNDTASFANALRAAMREDPDIVFVGEIRDRETAESVLRMAESWHLVFSTLHTPSAAFTINRFISFFPPDIQSSVCERLADILTWVQSQMLVKTADKSQRIGVFEIMFATAWIRNNIKKRDISQINSLIETSAGSWMISMKKYAEKLLEKWLISHEVVDHISKQLRMN